jgi:uncharacterized short protein YbdD (DUF466 family)
VPRIILPSKKLKVRIDIDSNASPDRDPKQLFLDRIRYSSFIEETKDFFPDYVLMDSWDSHRFYGKIDKFQNPIEPREDMIENFEGAQGHKAFNFVVKAYSDFKSKYEQAFRSGQCRSDSSFLEELKIYKSYDNLNREYIKYFKGILATFEKNFLLKKRRIEKVYNFYDLLEQFEIFALDMADEYPLTKSGFIMSGFCSSHSSGLSFDISDLSPGKDKEKYELFFRDKAFDFYVKLLRKFGFHISKNIPWRITANIRSNRMRPYMNAYGFSYPSIFTKAFDKPYNFENQKNDIFLIKTLLEDYYEDYISRFPYARKLLTGFSSYDITVRKIERKSPERKQITKMNFNKFLTHQYWFKFYLKLRAVENNLSWSRKTDKMQRKINKGINILRVLDMRAAMSYINAEVKFVPVNLKAVPFQDPYHFEPKGSISDFLEEDIIITPINTEDRLTPEEEAGSHH